MRFTAVLSVLAVTATAMPHGPEEPSGYGRGGRGGSSIGGGLTTVASGVGQLAGGLLGLGANVIGDVGGDLLGALNPFQRQRAQDAVNVLAQVVEEVQQSKAAVPAAPASA